MTSLVVIAMGFSLARCTSSRLFLLPGKTQEYRLFGHHFLKVLVTNAVYDEPGQTYRMYIAQEYRPPKADSFQADTVGVIEIDSLCMELGCLGQTLCPKLQEKRMPEGPVIQDGIVVGPAFNWGIATIPDQCDTLKLNFVATLHDRSTGAERARQPVKLVLTKKTKRVGSFLR